MTPKIPIIDLGAQLEPIRDEILDAITRCVDSGNYILGQEVDRFEDAVATYCGVEHAIGASSGTDALMMSLMALGFTEKARNLLTDFLSFPATRHSWAG